MRTALMLAAGLFLLAAFAIVGKAFAQNVPAAASWAIGLFLALWLAVTAANLWIGVSHAGYALQEELPVLLLLFGVPAVAAVIVKWKFL